MMMRARSVLSPAEAFQQATHFFRVLVPVAPADTVVALTRPPTWPLAVRNSGDALALARQALRWSALERDVYVRCTLLAAARIMTMSGRGRAEDAVVLPAVWGDLDIAKRGSRQRYVPDHASALRFLQRCPIRPTLRVGTGGGLHGWWCFREPVLITDETTRMQAERLVRRWQALLRSLLDGYALDSTHDLARVLRVPGTLNTKYGTSVVLEDASGPRVDPAELEDCCAHLPDVVPVHPHRHGAARPARCHRRAPGHEAGLALHGLTDLRRALASPARAPGSVPVRV
jgi:hypothetical protein